MKRTLKTAFAAMLALLMALAIIPFSALAAGSRTTPAWTVPEGYNAHDYEKCVNFLEQTDENGVKNGEKLSESYDPTDPGTWDAIYWSNDADRRAEIMSLREFGLVGYLDVSGCTELIEIDCSKNSIIELDVTGCTALEKLQCNYNNLNRLDVTSTPSLKELFCGANNLTELDVSYNTELNALSCFRNNLTELDLSNNTKLYRLSCPSNRLAELDLSNNPGIQFYNLIKAEGNGFIGLVYLQGEIMLFAQPINDASFYGFYSLDIGNSDTPLSLGNWSDLYQAYIYEPVWLNFDERIIARFSGGTAPTPAPSDEPVNPTDEPVNPTDAPVDPTDAPVDPTDAPVDPTDAPVDPTDAPVNPTNEPVNPTNAPVTPNPPATGTVALAGVGVAAIIGGIGAVAARRKKD